MNVRVVSPVPGEVVETSTVGIEIASLKALRTGEEYSFLLKRGFSTERLRGRVKWCIVDRLALGASPPSPAVFHCCIAVDNVDPRVLRFLGSSTSH